jgi:hypothetical protein
MQPPDGFISENDEAAMARAMQLIEGNDAELWQRDRLVVRLKSPHQLR